MKDAPEVKPDALAEMQKSLQATQDQLTTLLNKNEELAKKNTELQEVLKRNEEARAEQNRLSLAKSIVGNANVKVEDVSSLLKQLDASGTAVLTDLMKKYNAVLKQGGTLRAVGAESDDDGEMTVEKAEKVIDDATVEIVKLHGGKMSKADAYIEACRQNPDAYDVVMGRA
jgi:DNA repair exonuclease SbcCD ATPase subunit